MLADDLRERSAALKLAAAASELDPSRGEGLSRLSGVEIAVCIERGCAGEVAMIREGGSELRSGGDMAATADKAVGSGNRGSMHTRMDQSDRAIGSSP